MYNHIVETHGYKGISVVATALCACDFFQNTIVNHASPLSMMLFFKKPCSVVFFRLHSLLEIAYVNQIRLTLAMV